MLNHFISFLKDEHSIDVGRNFLLAVSGGMDSVVMVDLFSRAGFAFGIAHANFHLRGDESDRDEQFVRQLAQKYKVKIFTKDFDTPAAARSRKISIQVAARDLRYSWFEELLTEHRYDYLATAHHLDDQVETVLINLARGTGIAGLRGMPVKQGKIIRPMMFTGRNDINDYLVRHRLDYVEDSSNESLKYTRNRIRHKIIPQFERLNPSFRQSILETIEKVRTTEMIYMEIVEEKRKAIVHHYKETITIPVRDFYSLEPLSAWAYELLSPFGFSSSGIRDIIKLKDSIPGKEVISSTHRLIKDRDKLIIVPLVRREADETYRISAVDLMEGISSPIGLAAELPEQAPARFDNDPNVACIDLNRLKFPLEIRKWRRGDYFFPLGMNGAKKLSDFFIDLKFSKIDKENQWLLCSGDDIVWVIGKRIDDRFKITDDTRNIVLIRVLELFLPEAHRTVII